MIIGIDPGVITGIGIIEDEIKVAESAAIHQAMNLIRFQLGQGKNLHVRVEDARQRKWFGNNSQSKQQGAGSIKRDCKIWEDYLTDLQKIDSKLTFEMIHPIKGATKLTHKLFQKATGIQGKTNEHGRDAYMLIHGYKIKTETKGKEAKPHVNKLQKV
jgi:hypothetical protein